MPLIKSASGVEAMSYDQGALKVDTLFRDESSVSELKSVPGANIEASNPKEGGMAVRIAFSVGAR